MATAPSIKEIVNICTIRSEYYLPCKDCKFYGRYCERIKHKHKVKKPYYLKEYNYVD